MYRYIALALDRCRQATHTWTVAEGHWSLGRRVVVEDVRRDDTYMRVTWHEDRRVFVVSHWQGEVCIAATQVPVDAAPDLINLFVRGLAESSGQQSARPRQVLPPESLMARFKRLIRHVGRAA